MSSEKLALVNGITRMPPVQTPTIRGVRIRIVGSQKARHVELAMQRAGRMLGARGPPRRRAGLQAMCFMVCTSPPNRLVDHPACEKTKLALLEQFRPLEYMYSYLLACYFLCQLVGAFYLIAFPAARHVRRRRCPGLRDTQGCRPCVCSKNRLNSTGSYTRKEPIRREGQMIIGLSP